jgi:hypothetical protein
MTVTLVRPAGGGIAGFTAGTLVRVRPVPTMDPPDTEGPANPADPLSGAGSPGPALPGRGATGDGPRATRRYLDLTLEVLGGFRPIGHLRVLTDPARFDEVAGQLTQLGGPSVTRPGSGLARVTGDRVQLRQVRICEVHDGAVEAAAVLARGGEVRAMTLRLERRSRIWLCVHLRVL